MKFVEFFKRITFSSKKKNQFNFLFWNNMLQEPFWNLCSIKYGFFIYLFMYVTAKILSSELSPHSTLWPKDLTTCILETNSSYAILANYSGKWMEIPGKNFMCRWKHTSVSSWLPCGSYSIRIFCMINSSLFCFPVPEARWIKCTYVDVFKSCLSLSSMCFYSFTIYESTFIMKPWKTKFTSFRLLFTINITIIAHQFISGTRVDRSHKR